MNKSNHQKKQTKDKEKSNDFVMIDFPLGICIPDEITDKRHRKRFAQKAIKAYENGQMKF